MIVARIARPREATWWLAELRLLFGSVRPSVWGLPLASSARGWRTSSWPWWSVHSLSIPMRVEYALFVLLAVNLAIAIPAAPGNLGSLELGATFALKTLGVQGKSAPRRNSRFCITASRSFLCCFRGLVGATAVAVIGGGRSSAASPQ